MDQSIIARAQETDKLGVSYIDAYSKLIGTNNIIQQGYAKGVHPTPTGYIAWAQILMPYIYE